MCKIQALLIVPSARARHLWHPARYLDEIHRGPQISHDKANARDLGAGPSPAHAREQQLLAGALGHAVQGDKRAPVVQRRHLLERIVTFDRSAIAPGIT